MEHKKPLRADYVLFYRPNIPLAVVEAKDNKHNIADGMQQALKYAKMLDVPFAFSSNGDGFIFHNKLEKVGNVEIFLNLSKFPSPEELWEMYKNERSLSEDQKKIIDQPYYLENPEKLPRYYQINAVNKTLEAITNGRKRILLVMATGTGKTFTAFQIIWRLWKAKIKKRILFLANRKNLIAQTFSNDFSLSKRQFVFTKFNPNFF